jgi:protein SCO1/2
VPDCNDQPNRQLLARHRAGRRLAAITLLSMLCIPAPRAAVAAAPPNVAGLRFSPHPGATLPADADFRDQTGRTVRLGAMLRARPAIITLGYYHCPNLCGAERDDLFSALQQSGLVAGADYQVIALSIDPHETPADAAAAWRDDAARYPLGGGVDGRRYLTGDSTAVARAVGYAARWDDSLHQFIHPLGIVVTTQGGVVSAYLLGLGYTPQALRGAVRRAAAAFVAPPPAPVLLLCFHYDATTGRYSLAIMRVLRLAGLLTIAAIAGLLTLLHMRRPQHRLRADVPGPDHAD